MTDRETIIKGCEYWVKNHKGEQLLLEYSEVEDLLALLKEQDAVKPKSKSRHGEYPQIVHRCGNCNEVLYRYYKYCPTCGKAVKWE